MADNSTPYQSFAITLLLCTPSGLHDAWLKQNLDFPTLANLMKDLNFSPQAIKNAQSEYFDRLKHPDLKDVRKGMFNIGEKLRGGFYPPNGGAHPMLKDAKQIICALRKLDEGNLCS